MEKMLHAEIWTISQTRDGGAVLLRPKDTDIVIPVFIGLLESQSILIGNEGVHLPRPLTHDLFLNLLQSQNLSLKQVEIHEIVDNTFHARLVITGGVYTGAYPLILDSRPSDAFALAVRRKCPVFFSFEVSKQAGISFDLIFDSPENINVTDFPFGSLNKPSGNRNSLRSKELRILQDQLNAAVAKEEYEQAAKIRDMIKEMEDADG
jgi:bifunctional DNase/RNase